MSYFQRRFLGPLALIAVSLAGLVLWLRYSAPGVLRHAAATSTHSAQEHAGTTVASPLKWLTDAVILGVHVAAYTAGLLLVLALPVLVARLRARRQRAEPGRVLCAELRLGRDDQASPYEISKVFDGIAGALRPGIIRRPLAGPPTLTLRIVSEGGARSVRFLVQAPAIYHPAIAARLRATYPDTRLIPIDALHADPFALSMLASPGAAVRALLSRREPVPPVAVDMLRMKKARRWVWALATTKDYEHSLIESLLSVMHALTTPCVVELLLTPAPTLLERYTGHALVRRERRFIADRALGPNEPGADGVVAKKHLQGAVEGVGRAWWWFDLRVIVPRGHEPYARQVAGVIQETRGENYLRIRVMRLRRRLYAWRSGRGLPPLFPALWSGALSSAEVASLWHLPTLRLKGVPLRRISAREIVATSAISRDPAHAVMRDEHGPVGIHPADRRYGWMLLGTAGAGKTAALAPHVKAVADDDERALVIIDPKEDFARLCMGLIPTRRTVHYLDLGAPRYGLNILTAGHLTPEIRADIFISVIRELAGESSVGPRSDLFLRAALQAIMIVEPVPALQHVAALLDPYDAGYREWVTRELRCHHEIDFVRDYWEHTFPRMVKHNPRFFSEAVAAPANKIARFLTSPSLNLLMTHSVQLDLESIIQRREILIVNGSKGAVGESNANLFCSMLILLIQRALHQIQRVEAHERVQAALVIDEAHNVFIPAFSTLLAEGRSGGIEVAAAFQYTGQIADESVRAGVRSLLQNVSIFRQRDLNDARAAAALAMEVFQDNIRGDIEDQRRIRIDPIDIVQQPNYRSVNLWLAHGVPQPAATASTTPMEQLVATPAARRARGHHEREQHRRGDHPHDHGRYIQPPLVWSARRPILARYRTVHVDLPAWPEWTPLAEIVRVAVVLKPTTGEPLAYVAESPDGSRRRYAVELPAEPHAPGRYSEDALVEQPAIQLFDELGWGHINAYHETLGPNGTLGRDNRSEVFLTARVRHAVERLNPGVPPEAIEEAVNEITKPRTAMQYARANAEIHALLRNRVAVSVRQPDGTALPEKLAVMDWEHPENNDFLLVSQLWIHSDLYKRRADLVGFVNGIPLVFIELKASHRNLKHAYDDNLSDYRDSIPNLFVPNGFIVLSNGAETKVGTITSGWEFFSEWKKINSEGEEGVVSLETVIRGMCAKERVLDLIENFIVFQDLPGGFVKLLARNHQFLGVNNALARMQELRHAPSEERGKLGVFWHTQGSGKTLSMLFFSQKVLRKTPGNWSFVIVTDREDLDDQAHKEFLWAGVVTEKHVRATGSAHLHQLLSEDHRYVFTLIQKFRTEKGEVHPVISERDDVIVITDEAHRTQYDVLALNMRNALPNASFLGFTGTPLIAGEERTREVFGDYVSVYNFAASTADHATVPLYYENRIPQVEIANPTFGDDLMAIVEEADLDEAQERQLARKLGQQYELITRDDRLAAVARDIVDHFLGRGFPGKGLVVSIDKATTVRTFEKVQGFWAERLAADETRLASEDLSPSERDVLSQEIAFMRSTDMAVVISQSQNEIAEMAERGIDIKPHRKRIVEENLEEKFKDAEDPLRLAFVCSMWTTGFDVPSLSTVYLDKPLRNHTLMQTITRANRVFPEKNSGLIVAYVDVFRNLQKALAIYAIGGKAGSVPVEEKGALVDALRSAGDDLRAFCASREVDLDALGKLKGFELVAAGRRTVEMLMVDDEQKVAFLSRASLVNRLYKAILPDVRANEFSRLRAVAKFLADAIAEYTERPDVSGVMGRVEQLLDESIAANEYLIPETEAEALFDLGAVDWAGLEEAFKQGRPRTAAQRLRSLLSAQIAALVRLNPVRVDLVERFEKLVADYNAGSMNVEAFFQELLAFKKTLSEEEARALSEGLDEEHLAVFDLLMRPAPELSEVEKTQVKKVADELLSTLKHGKLVLDWRKQQATRASVRVAIEETLDRLPEAFTRQIYAQKCDAVYQHVFDSYWDDGQSVYQLAA